VIDDQTNQFTSLSLFFIPPFLTVFDPTPPAIMPGAHEFFFTYQRDYVLSIQRHVGLTLDFDERPFWVLE
jgi:hypothetical protein